MAATSSRTAARCRSLSVAPGSKAMNRSPSGRASHGVRPLLSARRLPPACFETIAISLSAITFNIASPPSCPMLSLICLKRSRLIRSRQCEALDLARTACTRRMNSPRLASPVSASCLSRRSS
jgi:hypothetical protein